MVDIKRWFGVWKLESCEFQTAEGNKTYPYGKSATGCIIYLENNRMAVVISGENRENFAKNDMLGGSTDEKSAAI